MGLWGHGPTLSTGLGRGAEGGRGGSPLWGPGSWLRTGRGARPPTSPTTAPNPYVVRRGFGCRVAAAASNGKGGPPPASRGRRQKSGASCPRSPTRKSTKPRVENRPTRCPCGHKPRTDRCTAVPVRPSRWKGRRNHAHPTRRGGESRRGEFPRSFRSPSGKRRKSGFRATSRPLPPGTRPRPYRLPGARKSPTRRLSLRLRNSNVCPSWTEDREECDCGRCVSSLGDLPPPSWWPTPLPCPTPRPDTGPIPPRDVLPRHVLPDQPRVWGWTESSLVTCGPQGASGGPPGVRDLLDAPWFRRTPNPQSDPPGCGSLSRREKGSNRCLSGVLSP